MIKQLAIFFLALFAVLSTTAQVSVYNLQCESLQNPEGVDIPHPRLSWQLESSQRGVLQTAYQIIVSSTPKKLAANEGDIWNTGKRNSDSSINIIYDGAKLESRSECFWKVKVWTNKGETEWSNTASWATGLRYYKDWGRWIGFDRYFSGDDAATGRLSARYFRKEISISKTVAKATVYIMGLGLYELSVDGNKIGDQVLAPAPTDYGKTIKYNTLDVTAQLKQGKHVLGVVLGNGRFYAMRQAKPYKVKTFGFPQLMMTLIINYTDGSSATIRTDDTWKGTADGPITANNEYDGETYDAQREMRGWDKPDFDETKWLKAEFVQEPGGNFEPQLTANMKVMQDIAAVSITAKSGGRYIVDFGQNFSGWVKLKLADKKGQQITLRFAESLQENGELFTANLRDAKAKDYYTFKGEGIEEWEPKFTYHGFRYAEISGLTKAPAKENFTGRFVYDNMKTIGTFECSNSLLNQIHKNAWWGIASNYKGMPVDCPQRNERQPWLGDRPISSYGESFLFDNTGLYAKWLDDITDAQKPDGAIPDVAPAFWRYYSDNMTWPSALPLITQMIYTQTGNVSVVRKKYPAIKKWLQYMTDQYLDDNGILTKDSYGDWCVPPVTAEAGRGVNADQKHPSALLATAYYAHLSGLMARFAGLIGNSADSLLFAKRADEAKTAFHKKFYHAEGFYGEDNLTDNLLPVYFDIVPKALKPVVWKRVAEIVEVKNNNHLSTGLVGVQWLMRGLVKIGRSDLAYKVATQTTYPSWGYMVNNGATTIWELWNGNTAAPSMNSQNHVMMLGDLLVWYYECLAGIKSSEEQAGFKQIMMKPTFVKDLKFVNASYQSPYGLIKSHWQQTAKSFHWDITVPPNTKALVYLPATDKNKVTESGKKADGVNGIEFKKMEDGTTVFEVSSGTYSFDVK